MASDFLECLPGGFHNPDCTQVYTVEIMKKGVKFGDETIYNMEKLYGYLLVISNKRNLPLEQVFAFEHATLHSSMFDDSGLMWKTSKSTILFKLIVPYSGKVPVDIQLVDGNELIYHTTWPNFGSQAHLCMGWTLRCPSVRPCPQSSPRPPRRSGNLQAPKGHHSILPARQTSLLLCCTTLHICFFSCHFIIPNRCQKSAHKCREQT